MLRLNFLSPLEIAAMSPPTSTAQATFQCKTPALVSREAFERFRERVGKLYEDDVDYWTDPWIENSAGMRQLLFCSADFLLVSRRHSR